MAWPNNIGVLQETWTIDWAPRTAGAAFSGFRQVSGSLSDLWRAQVTLLIRPAQFTSWNAFVARKQGSIKSTPLGPLGQAEYIEATGSTLSAAAVKGATSVDVDVTDATAILDEAYLGLGDRLYMVYAKTENTGTNVTLDFWPPLRANVANTTALDATPRTDMRMLNPVFAEASLDGVATVNLDLVEDLA